VKLSCHYPVATRQLYSLLSLPCDSFCHVNQIQPKPQESEIIIPTSINPRAEFVSLYGNAWKRRSQTGLGRENGVPMLILVVGRQLHQYQLRRSSVWAFDW